MLNNVSSRYSYQYQKLKKEFEYQNDKKFCRPNFGPDETEDYQAWAKIHSTKAKAMIKNDLSVQIREKNVHVSYQDQTEKQVELQSKSFPLLNLQI